MNSNTRDYWPLVRAEAERTMGVAADVRFPAHNRMALHTVLFAHDIPIVENLSGAVAELIGRQAHVCAFPWKFDGRRSGARPGGRVHRS